MIQHNAYYCYKVFFLWQIFTTNFTIVWNLNQIRKLNTNTAWLRNFLASSEIMGTLQNFLTQENFDYNKKKALDLKTWLISCIIHTAKFPLLHSASSIFPFTVSLRPKITRHSPARSSKSIKQTAKTPKHWHVQSKPIKYQNQFNHFFKRR